MMFIMPKSPFGLYLLLLLSWKIPRCSAQCPVNRCILGLFGSWIYKVSSGGGCTQQCVLIPALYPGYNCGKCPATTPIPPNLEPVPPGPYVAAGFSERIILPQPPKPSSTSRSNCPDQQSNLKNWHDASTWPNGQIPSTVGQAVTLPASTKVLISKTVTPRLGIVTIPSTSQLIFADAGGVIDFQANGMIVQGALRMGSPTCRVDNTKITITLHGARPTNIATNKPPNEYKGISVLDGVIDIHGKRYYKTWSRLARTLEANSNVLVLQDVVNWEIGQTIVVTTTALKDSREWHQNEKFTIRHIGTVSGVPGSVVWLDRPATYRHVGNRNYQAEVGLLTRKIVIQGSATDSEPTDPDPKNCKSPDKRFGDDAAPCGYKEITGFGGHIIVHGSTGKGFIEGVEFFRMGQTNVIGRYPMHFHLLGETCVGCYLRDSAFHRSFYRCVSVHATNAVEVSENVAYDITGYCYYLEDGVEERNNLNYNLAAFIHAIGPEPVVGTGSQTTKEFVQDDEKLAFPGDVTASGFYIPNVRNNLVGNAASGGWAGFAFPLLPTPIQTSRDSPIKPVEARSLNFDGNTAHSTGWWWDRAGAFYFSGTLYYNEDNKLEYIPGRYIDDGAPGRPSCDDKECEEIRGDIQLKNSKVFLVSGVGLNSWSGTFDILGYESHDTGLALESISDGFWVHNMLAVCRTGEQLVFPKTPAPNERMRGDGFFGYDTDVKHFITSAKFRNCGYRSNAFAQYDTSPDRGCGDNDFNGCSSISTVIGLPFYSDQFSPQLMTATKGISFEKCGRRYLLNYYGLPPAIPSQVSGRTQNWFDADGTASGLNVPTFIVSGYPDVASWFQVDDDVVYDAQGPLRFIRRGKSGLTLRRGLAHLTIFWDENIHNQVGVSSCTNGDLPCGPEGYIRHAGLRFSALGPGQSLTATGNVVGPVGGYGWILTFNGKTPRKITFQRAEVLPNTPLLISIPYPPGTTTFRVTIYAADYCYPTSTNKCSFQFQQVSSMQQVRNGPGNLFHVENSVLSLRIVQTSRFYLSDSNGNWYLPSLTSTIFGGEFYTIPRFSRDGILLPFGSSGLRVVVEAECGGTGTYCTGTPVSYNPDVCPPNYVQKAYDYCCSISNPSTCVVA